MGSEGEPRSRGERRAEAHGQSAEAHAQSAEAHAQSAEARTQSAEARTQSAEAHPAERSSADAFGRRHALPLSQKAPVIYPNARIRRPGIRPAEKLGRLRRLGRLSTPRRLRTPPQLGRRRCARRHPPIPPHVDRSGSDSGVPPARRGQRGTRRDGGRPGGGSGRPDHGCVRRGEDAERIPDAHADTDSERVHPTGASEPGGSDPRAHLLGRGTVPGRPPRLAGGAGGQREDRSGAVRPQCSQAGTDGQRSEDTDVGRGAPGTRPGLPRLDDGGEGKHAGTDRARRRRRRDPVPPARRSGVLLHGRSEDPGPRRTR